jgi:CBS domain-containing protein
MKVQDLLKEKNRAVLTIAGNRSVDDAVNLMAIKKAGALIVTENERPVGIFTERDVFRFYLADKTTPLSQTAVQDAMIAKRMAAKPEDEISAVLAVMTTDDIRHMPVVEDNNVIGILTLNDLIAHQIESLTDEIQQLREYIEDLHEAGRD